VAPADRASECSNKQDLTLLWGDRWMVFGFLLHAPFGSFLAEKTCLGEDFFLSIFGEVSANPVLVKSELKSITLARIVKRSFKKEESIASRRRKTITSRPGPSRLTFSFLLTRFRSSIGRFHSIRASASNQPKNDREENLFHRPSMIFHLSFRLPLFPLSANTAKWKKKNSGRRNGQVSGKPRRGTLSEV
jgi:hypothetical protein